MRRWLATGVCLVALVAQGAALRAKEAVPDAAALFQHGRLHLEAGELEAALAAFQQAADLDRAYAEHALVLKRVLGIRAYVARAAPSAKWARMVATLHAYYLQHGVHASALALDRDAHGRLPDGDSEALALLDRSVAWARDLRHGIWRGVALARMGRIEAARAQAAALRMPAADDPVLLRERARLETLLEDRDAALARLARAFAATRAAALADAKSAVRRCSDFARLLGAPAFERVMRTASGVKETSCSGGSDCGSCPNRGGCPKSRGG